MGTEKKHRNSEPYRNAGAKEVGKGIKSATGGDDTLHQSHGANPILRQALFAVCFVLLGMWFQQCCVPNLRFEHLFQPNDQSARLASTETFNGNIQPSDSLSMAEASDNPIQHHPDLVALISASLAEGSRLFNQNNPTSVAQVVFGQIESALDRDCPDCWQAHVTSPSKRLRAWLRKLSPETLRTVVNLLNAAAQLLSNTRHFAQAYQLHLRASCILDAGNVAGSTPSELIEQRIQLATYMNRAGRHHEAIELIQNVMRAHARLPPSALAILHRLLSNVYDCSGALTMSLAAMEASVKDTLNAESTISASKPASDAAPSGSTEQLDQLPTSLVQEHADLLQRVALSSEDTMPESVRQQIREAAADRVLYLLQRGPWRSPLQLPRTFIPGLKSMPWHDPSEYPLVAEAVDYLASAAEQLRAELVHINASGLLFPETECIHDPRGGRWVRHEVTAPWHDRDIDSNCSLAAPRACEAFRHLRGLGLKVIRAGYSVIGPHAHLHPHYGMTNGQLKLHLGLIVPRAQDGSACAVFTVGTETRAWSQDRVLFFDDSFRHEVWNNCGQERAVFQVVFEHPELRDRGGLNMDVFDLRRSGVPAH